MKFSRCWLVISVLVAFAGCSDANSTLPNAIGGAGLLGESAGTSAGTDAAGIGAAGELAAAGSGSAGTTATRDVKGPCKDLNLPCFDAFDAYTFNPDCFTCNNGAGGKACVNFKAE